MWITSVRPSFLGTRTSCLESQFGELTKIRREKISRIKTDKFKSPVNKIWFFLTWAAAYFRPIISHPPHTPTHHQSSSSEDWSLIFHVRSCIDYCTTPSGRRPIKWQPWGVRSPTWPGDRHVLCFLLLKWPRSGFRVSSDALFCFNQAMFGN